MSLTGVVIALVMVGLYGYEVAAIEVSDDMKELMAMLHKTCVEETGATEDMISGTLTGNFPEEQVLKCYMKCILIQGAGMDDDGIIDVEGIIAMLPDGSPVEVATAMRKCGTVTGADHCDTAFLTNKCWYENCPHYFLI